MRNILDAAVLKETNAKVLRWQAFGRNIYLSKGAAIRTPGDLENKKVRTYGKVLGWRLGCSSRSASLSPSRSSCAMC